MHALKRFLGRCRKLTVVICKLRPPVAASLGKLSVLAHVETADTYADAIPLAASAIPRGRWIPKAA